ncbi:MAG: DUF3089 domain-containing protein [Bacteroidota bacterium]
MSTHSILKQIKKWLVSAILFILVMSCGKDEKPSGIIPTDYSLAEHWLSLPADTAKPVDIFYLYPTAWTPDSATNTLYCAIDNPSMLAGSLRALKTQATVFETTGNIYSPYYRQTNAVKTLVLPEDQRWEVLRQEPGKDVVAAFDYYINHYNNGRPFILAGHSQGASVLLVLLTEYMANHPEVYSRMIAAYVTGYPVTAEFMAANKHLKFAKGPDDTGVIISYNTQSPKVVPGANIVVANNIGLVINPINWRRDETPAPATESLGSYMPGKSLIHYEKVPYFADAQIDLVQGVLICKSVNDSAMAAISGGLGLGVYHIYDISLYYYNLRQNAGNRAGKFLGK